jgi:hypothetical protein
METGLLHSQQNENLFGKIKHNGSARSKTKRSHRKLLGGGETKVSEIMHFLQTKYECNY